MVLLIIGIIITIFSIVMYFCNYARINIEQLLKHETQITMMSISVIAFFLGITFLISTLNLKNKSVRFVLTLLLGSLIYAVIREKPIRIAFIMMSLMLIVFVLTKVFAKVFCTIITFSLSCILIMIFLKIFLGILPQIHFCVALYSSFTIMLLLYNIFGVRLNKLCLKHLFGYSTEYLKQYDEKELANQINLMYLVIFVIFNLSAFYSNQDVSLTAECIDHALATGLCITNIKWKNLFWEKDINHSK